MPRSNSLALSSVRVSAQQATLTSSAGGLTLTTSASVKISQCGDLQVFSPEARACACVQNAGPTPGQTRSCECFPGFHAVAVSASSAEQQQTPLLPQLPQPQQQAQRQRLQCVQSPGRPSVLVPVLASILPVLFVFLCAAGGLGAAFLRGMLRVQLEREKLRRCLIDQSELKTLHPAHIAEGDADAAGESGAAAAAAAAAMVAAADTAAAPESPADPSTPKSPSAADDDDLLKAPFVLYKGFQVLLRNCDTWRRGVPDEQFAMGTSIAPSEARGGGGYSEADSESMMGDRTTDWGTDHSSGRLVSSSSIGEMMDGSRREDISLSFTAHGKKWNNTRGPSMRQSIRSSTVSRPSTASALGRDSMRVAFGGFLPSPMSTGSAWRMSGSGSRASSTVGGGGSGVEGGGGEGGGFFPSVATVQRRTFSAGGSRADAAAAAAAAAAATAADADHLQLDFTGEDQHSDAFAWAAADDSRAGSPAAAALATQASRCTSTGAAFQIPLDIITESDDAAGVAAAAAGGGSGSGVGSRGSNRHLIPTRASKSRLAGLFGPSSETIRSSAASVTELSDVVVASFKKDKFSSSALSAPGSYAKGSASSAAPGPAAAAADEEHLSKLKRRRIAWDQTNLIDLCQHRHPNIVRRPRPRPHANVRCWLPHPPAAAGAILSETVGSLIAPAHSH